jgi:hypothetical protein
MSSLRVLLLAVLAGLSAPLHAQQQLQMAPPPSEARWVSDPTTGCRVWSANPMENEGAQWFGPCPNGYAQGRGVLQWLVDGKPVRRDEGDFRDGKLTGPGTRTEADGARYEGFWRASRAHGAGRYVTPDGNVFEGFWRNGCVRPEGQHTPVGMVPPECFR